MVLLDFSAVSFADEEAVKMLRRMGPKKIHLINCSAFMECFIGGPLRDQARADRGKS
jgi:hypothetical protein